MRVGPVSLCALVAGDGAGAVRRVVGAADTVVATTRLRGR
jgi:hypothetical protein